MPFSDNIFDGSVNKEFLCQNLLEKAKKREC